MRRKSDRYNDVTRWILGGGLAIYGFQAKGWRRWLALTAAGSLLQVPTVWKPGRES